MTLSIFIIFLILLFIMAFLYASVGHGGASGYLAVMAILSVSPEVMKPTALILNLFVSLTAFIQYYRGNHFKLNIFLPLALASIPLSFLGGMITLEDHIYKTILGLFLFIPIVRFLFYENKEITELKESNLPLSLMMGSSIGFISGLIGMGGGIVLSPLLVMLKWSNLKQTAAISALFIFVNSLSGIIGQSTKGLHLSNEMYYYISFAFCGGLLGAYYGANKFSHKYLKIVLALVLLIAAVKLILV
jgi:uncharacterized protein